MQLEARNEVQGVRVDFLAKCEFEPVRGCLEWRGGHFGTGYGSYSISGVQYGHALEGDNLHISTSGARVCRTCKRRRRKGS